MKYCGYWTWAIHSVVSINDCQWHEISSIQIQNTEEKHCSVGHIQYIKMSSEETYSPFDSWCAHICHLQKTRLQHNVTDWDFFSMHLSSKWLHINRWRTYGSSTSIFLLDAFEHLSDFTWLNDVQIGRQSCAEKLKMLYRRNAHVSKYGSSKYILSFLLDAFELF